MYRVPGLVAGLAMFLFAPSVLAGNGEIAVVSKQMDHPYFDVHRDGCLAANETTEGPRCAYFAPVNDDPREQDQLIARLLDEGYEAIAVAVINSDLLARSSLKRAAEMGVPVITFDADLSPEHTALRRAYVGSDNRELGRLTAEEMVRLSDRPHAYCLQSSRLSSPNLAERVAGATAVFEAAGWPLHARCPMEFEEELDRSIRQLEYVLSKSEEDEVVFVAVGGWPQFHPGYGAAVEPFRQALANRHALLGFIDTDAVQIDYLRQGLAHANVGQDPFQQGRQAALVLRRILAGEEVDEVTLTPLIICRTGLAEPCAIGQDGLTN